MSPAHSSVFIYVAFDMLCIGVSVIGQLALLSHRIHLSLGNI